MDLAAPLPGAREAGAEVLERVEVAVKYEGYVRRQERAAAEAVRLESQEIPADLAFETIPGFSSEAASKLARLRPRNLGQASRIDGVRAADLSLLLVHLKRRASEVPA